MTDVNTHSFACDASDPYPGARRFAGGHDDRSAPDAADPLELLWPRRWPAALYRGDLGTECEVQTFTGAGACVKMPQPPAKGTLVSLKFPFTVYLRGTVISSGPEILEIAFDEEARRSARLVEDVLLNHNAASRASAA